MYAAGNSLVILEVSTMKRRVIFGLDGGGVGCFAVHPTGTLVAVGDKGSMPNIYVYEYPSFKIAKVRVLPEKQPLQVENGQSVMLCVRKIKYRSMEIRMTDAIAQERMLDGRLKHRFCSRLQMHSK